MQTLDDDDDPLFASVERPSDESREDKNKESSDSESERTVEPDLFLVHKRPPPPPTRLATTAIGAVWASSARPYSSPVSALAQTNSVPARSVVLESSAHTGSRLVLEAPPPTASLAVKAPPSAPSTIAPAPVTAAGTGGRQSQPFRSSATPTSLLDSRSSSLLRSAGVFRPSVSLKSVAVGGGGAPTPPKPTTPTSAALSSAPANGSGAKHVVPPPRPAIVSSLERATSAPPTAAVAKPGHAAVETTITVPSSASQRLPAPISAGSASAGAPDRILRVVSLPIQPSDLRSSASHRLTAEFDERLDSNVDHPTGSLGSFVLGSSSLASPSAAAVAPVVPPVAAARGPYVASGSSMLLPTASKPGAPISDSHASSSRDERPGRDDSADGCDVANGGSRRKRHREHRSSRRLSSDDEEGEQEEEAGYHSFTATGASTSAAAAAAPVPPQSLQARVEPVPTSVTSAAAAAAPALAVVAPPRRLRDRERLRERARQRALEESTVAGPVMWAQTWSEEDMRLLLFEAIQAVGEDAFKLFVDDAGFELEHVWNWYQGEFELEATDELVTTMAKWLRGRRDINEKVEALFVRGKQPSRDRGGSNGTIALRAATAAAAPAPLALPPPTPPPSPSTMTLTSAVNISLEKRDDDAVAQRSPVDADDAAERDENATAVQRSTDAGRGTARRESAAVYRHDADDDNDDVDDGSNFNFRRGGRDAVVDYFAEDDIAMIDDDDDDDATNAAAAEAERDEIIEISSREEEARNTDEDDDDSNSTCSHSTTVSVSDWEAISICRSETDGSDDSSSEDGAGDDEEEDSAAARRRRRNMLKLQEQYKKYQSGTMASSSIDFRAVVRAKGRYCIGSNSRLMALESREGKKVDHDNTFTSEDAVADKLHLSAAAVRFLYDTLQRDIVSYHLLRHTTLELFPKLQASGGYVIKDGFTTSGLENSLGRKQMDSLTPGLAHPRVMQRLRALTALAPGDLVVDVGHGEGFACLGLAMASGCSAFGVEVVPRRAKGSTALFAKMVGRMIGSRTLAVSAGYTYDDSAAAAAAVFAPAARAAASSSGSSGNGDCDGMTSTSAVMLSAAPYATAVAAAAAAAASSSEFSSSADVDAGTSPTTAEAAALSSLSWEEFFATVAPAPTSPLVAQAHASSSSTSSLLLTRRPGSVQAEPEAAAAAATTSSFSTLASRSRGGTRSGSSSSTSEASFTAFALPGSRTSKLSVSTSSAAANWSGGDRGLFPSERGFSSPSNHSETSPTQTSPTFGMLQQHQLPSSSPRSAGTQPCCVLCAAAVLRSLPCPCNCTDGAAAASSGCLGSSTPVLFARVPPRPNRWHDPNRHVEYSPEFVFAASAAAAVRELGQSAAPQRRGGPSFSSSSAYAAAAAASAVPRPLAPLHDRVRFIEGDALAVLSRGNGLEAIRRARVVYCNNFSNKWETDGFQQQLFRLLSRVMSPGAILSSATRFTRGTRGSGGLCDLNPARKGAGEMYSSSALFFEVCAGWTMPHGGIADVIANPDILLSPHYDKDCEEVWARGRGLPQFTALKYMIDRRKEAGASRVSSSS